MTIQSPDGNKGAVGPSRRLDARLYCSFCGKGNHQVRQLIAGETAMICNECIALCVEIYMAPKHPLHERYAQTIVTREGGDATAAPGAGDSPRVERDPEGDAPP